MSQRTVNLTYKSGGEFANAHEVVLASEDGSYGVKEIDTQNVVVPSGTPVDNPETGKYEYIFTADGTASYIASWEITPWPGAEPLYRIQVVEPLVSSPSTYASTEYRGSFQQGTVAMLQLRITDLDGEAVDPEEIAVTIYDENGDIPDDQQSETLGGVVPEKALRGFYVLDWAIRRDEKAGKYTVEWKYTVSGSVNTILQEVVVSEDAKDTAKYSGRLLQFRESLSLMLDAVQHIPVYQEQATASRDGRTFRWTVGNWNQTPGVKIYRNQEFVTGGFKVDFAKGSVNFNEPMTSYDVILADYNFRWFSDLELDRFLSNGIHKLNSYAPHTGYSISNVPDKYIIHVLYGAAVDALRSVLLALNLQQPQQFFGGAEGADKAYQHLEQLKQNYEEQAVNLLEQKKLFPYKGLTKSVVAPEFVLPGGRSRWFRYMFSGNSMG